MLSRSQIQFVRSLQQNKYRKEYQCFTAEGVRLVDELLQSRLEFHSLYATREWVQKYPQPHLSFQHQLFIVTENELGRLSSLKTANQVLAVIRIPESEFDPETASHHFVLMLDNISDPGNFGTILRTADWFGIHHVICSPDTVDVFNPKTVQASMGSIARVHVYYHDLKSALISLSPNIPVYGALLKGKELKNISFSKNGILLIGNEAHGISANIIEYISHPVFIPSFLKGLPGYQRPESLNAAVATAILCYEVRRN